MNSEVEARLRESLARHAAQAPDAATVAQRILDRVEGGSVVPLRPRRSMPTWVLPLVASGAVAATVVAVVVGVGASRHNAVPPPVGTHTPSVTSTPTVTTTPTATPPPTPPSSYFLRGAVLGDLSFVGAKDGWGLVSLPCTGPTKHCAAMIRTIDGGKTWDQGATPPANVTLIRFATDKIGYAFGPTALYLTTDGGAHWDRQSGGADALETLDGNVIRVTADGCTPPGCTYRVLTAPLGSSTWTQSVIQASGDGVQLVRSGSRAYLAVFLNPAGGASNARASVYLSGDDGRTWTPRGEPCPQIGTGPAGNEVDTAAITAAPDGSVVALCSPRAQGTGAGLQFTITSTDGGGTFHAGPATVPSFAEGVAASSVRDQFACAEDGLYASFDGGLTWHKRVALSVNYQLQQGKCWVGFESVSTGRFFRVGDATIFTTHNGGQTWTPFAFR